jgi:hypothetical protein
LSENQKEKYFTRINVSNTSKYPVFLAWVALLVTAQVGEGSYLYILYQVYGKQRLGKNVDVTVTRERHIIFFL